MSLREPSLSVPNAEGVPRLSDIALFLCGKAVASAWSPVITADSRAAETIATWYLQRVAFMHESTPNEIAETQNRNTTAVEESQDGGEANFSVAFSALSRGPPCERNSQGGSSSQQRQRSSSIPTVFGFAERVASPTSPIPTAAGTTFTAPTASTTTTTVFGGRLQLKIDKNESGRAFAIFEEFLELCRDVGGADVREEFLRRIILLLRVDVRPTTRLPQPFWAAKSHEERGSIVLSALSKLFGVLKELSAVHAVGSVTRAFAIWMGVSWNCASFNWQVYVAQETGRWLADLEIQLGGLLATNSDAYGGSRANIRPPQRPKSNKNNSGCSLPKSFYPATENKRGLNLASMYAAMRQISETRSLEKRSTLELLIQNGNSLQISDFNFLEHMINDQPYGLGVHDTQQSHHSVLLRITSGVLLYAQFYLSVRSLEAALHCAHMAVLVGHQWSSNEFLTMAHYSSFLVHFACQDTPAAAGDIAIMLQLADAASHRDNITDNDVNMPRHHAGCLGYMGAALLLLICPGTVDTYLRSVIVTGIVFGNSSCSDNISASAGIGVGNSNNNNNGINSNRNNSGNSVQNVAVSTSGGHSVVVQTVAQTVRHALWLSEMESFLDPSSTVVTEIITGVARDTMMIIAGYYGVRSSSKPINPISLGNMLNQLDEEISIKSSLLAYKPPVLLLQEVIRQTAHRALAAQVGTAEAPPGGGPFSILHDFFLAVETHYGEQGIKVVQENFFYVSTYRFMCAMWLRNHGYIKSAYQELTRLGESMLFHSCPTDGGETLSSSSSIALPTTTSTTTTKTAENVLDNGNSSESSAVVKKTGLQYWPPDHLLLWQHIQFERAQLAHYLGYSSTIPGISEALRRVSAASHFVMGVLYADLISAMMCSQRGNHSAALEALEKISHSADTIGLTLLQSHAELRRVSVLLHLCRWRDALDALRRLEPLPLILQRWCLFAQLHARGELLLSCATATEDELAALVECYVERMEACGCFLPEVRQGDSVGISLLEQLCVHACVSRLSLTSAPAEQQAWASAVRGVAEALGRRQLQEGRGMMFSNAGMPHVCRDVLSGAMLQQLQQTQ
ncbi:hypothetical protein LSM04_006100 [Trypanosoma melophagium]|uniref:uncharacterized protein n=1 Tax=Trypanosoma melophagium TaxID=715481 RepID=UPI00351A8E54|nr:hypothetical protein LSM04_006100 [Trypanosoma melophagium]